MTEGEWLTAIRPTGMLLFLRSCGSSRKVLLFNLACCGRVWSLLGDEDRKRFVQADSVVDDREATRRLVVELEPERTASLALAGLREVSVTGEQAHLLRSQSKLRLYIDTELNWSVGGLAFHAASMRHEESDHPEREAEERAQSDLVRDIFGNPFRPVAFDPRWWTADVVALARGIYEDRAFDRLPLLADALMDAGCDHEDIVAHCRSVGPHVRGCWVVDLVLGKE
jgi:hypothetical protein